MSRRDYELREPTLRREQTAGSEELSGELRGESEEPQPTESKDDADARRDFWSTQSDFTYRHHNEPRVQLHVPKEETFPVPLNVDANRSLSDSWKGFTKFALLKENHPKGYVWSGRRLTKNQATARPENMCPELWTKIGKASQKREKQEWANEKPKPDNARRMRGSRMRGESRKCIWTRLCRAQKKTKGPTSSQETVARLNAPNKVPKKRSRLV